MAALSRTDLFPHPQFIEGRLEKLNTGEGFSDLFEEEITCSGAFSGEPCTWPQSPHPASSAPA